MTFFSIDNLAIAFGGLRPCKLSPSMCEKGDIFHHRPQWRR